MQYGFVIRLYAKIRVGRTTVAYLALPGDAGFSSIGVNDYAVNLIYLLPNSHRKVNKN